MAQLCDPQPTTQYIGGWSDFTERVGEEDDDDGVRSGGDWFAAAADALTAAPRAPVVTWAHVPASGFSESPEEGWYTWDETMFHASAVPQEDVPLDILERADRVRQLSRADVWRERHAIKGEATAALATLRPFVRESRIALDDPWQARHVLALLSACREGDANAAFAAVAPRGSAGLPANIDVRAAVAALTDPVKVAERNAAEAAAREQARVDRQKRAENIAQHSRDLKAWKASRSLTPSDYDYDASADTAAWVNPSECSSLHSTHEPESETTASASGAADNAAQPQEKNMTEFVNLTPHAVTMKRADGETFTVPPSGQEARRDTMRAERPALDGVPVVVVTFGDVKGLPEPREGTVYIVSGLALAAVPHRADVVAPGAPIREAGFTPAEIDAVVKAIGAQSHELAKRVETALKGAQGRVMGAGEFSATPAYNEQEKGMAKRNNETFVWDMGTARKAQGLGSDE